MLDQNTDRLWYVIGAVLLGAAIILLLNGTAPQIFGQVAGGYQHLTEQTLKDIEEAGLGGNQLTPDQFQTVGATITNYDPETKTYSLDVPSSKNRNWSAGLMIVGDEVRVPYGESFVISYDLYIPEGYSDEDVFVRNDVNAQRVGTDFVSWKESSGHDNLGKRVYNGTPEARTSVQAGEWNTIWFSYENTNPSNTEAVPLFDYSVFGVYNNTDDVIPVKIRNIQGRASM